MFPYTFSWADGRPSKGVVEVFKYGFHLMGTKLAGEDRGYKAEISIPFSSIGVSKPQPGEQIPFNLIIGDNDDHYSQETNLAMFNDPELNNSQENKKPGFITLGLANRSSGLNSLNATYNPIKVDNNYEDWEGFKPFKLTKIIRGFIKDESDLDVYVKACWDHSNLYLQLLIMDSNTYYLSYDKDRLAKSFSDYGWITDENGKVIWTLHVLDSRHAGGGS